MFIERRHNICTLNLFFKAPLLPLTTDDVSMETGLDNPTGLLELWWISLVDSGCCGDKEEWEEPVGETVAPTGYDDMMAGDVMGAADDAIMVWQCGMANC